MVVGGVFGRIYTVATGVADIAHYYVSAMDLLEAPTWSARLQAALTWAPLHPLLLAVTIHWLGAEWTYFLNPLFTWGLLSGLGAWGWRATRDYRCGVLTALAGAAILLFGYEQNIYFMLYPFRESLSFVFICSAMVAVLLAYPEGRGSRPVWLLCAGCGYVLAAAVREPAILALSGAAAYVLMQSRQPLRTRIRDLVVLGIPLLTALLIVAGIFVHTGIMGSAQFAGWRSMTEGTSFAAWRAMYGGYLNWLCQLLGPWGAGISAIGLVWMACRNRPAVVLLLLSLLSTLALYSTFAVYPRYALSAAIFLVPFLGAGLRAVVLGIARLGGGGGRRWPEHAAYALGILGILVFCGVKSAGLSPWGGVDRVQLRTFEQAVRAHLDPAKGVLTDSRSRLLNIVLKEHLGVDPVTFFQAPTMGGEVRRLLFIQPINEEAVVRAKVRLSSVSMEADILSHADLEPVRDERSRPLILTLGTGEYVLQDVRPWSRRRVEQALSADDVVGGLLWLDFQESDAAAERQVRLLGPDGSEIQRWPLQRGNGLIPFYVEPTSMHEGVSYRVAVESAGLLPAEMVRKPQIHGDAASFTMAQGRLPSALKWVLPPAYRSPPQEVWGAVFGDAAAFDFPVPQGMSDGEFLWVFTLEPRFSSKQKVVFHYTVDGGPVLSFTNRLDRQRFAHEIPLPAPFSRPRAHLDVQVEVPPGFDNFFKVVAIGCRIRQGRAGTGGSFQRGDEESISWRPDS